MKKNWGNLPKFQQEPSWQDKVDAAKQAYIAMSTADLARYFAIVRKAKQGLEEQVTEQNKHLEALSQLLVENLEAQDIQKVTLDSGATVYLSSEPYSSIEDKAKLMAWVKRQKLQAMLMVHFKTLGSLVKERLINGQAPPPGVKVFIKVSARLRNGNAEEE